MGAAPLPRLVGICKADLANTDCRKLKSNCKGQTLVGNKQNWTVRGVVSSAQLLTGNPNAPKLCSR